MRASFHRFLLMLLMLALPLQGFASVTLLDCMVSHLPAMETVAMADAMAGCHEQEPADGPAAQHNCTHCAACALASALPVPMRAIAAVQPTPNTYSLQAAESFSGFIPDGPERPPRSILA